LLDFIFIDMQDASKEGVRQFRILKEDEKLKNTALIIYSTSQ